MIKHTDKKHRLNGTQKNKQTDNNKTDRWTHTRNKTNFNQIKLQNIINSLSKSHI